MNDHIKNHLKEISKHLPDKILKLHESIQESLQLNDMNIYEKSQLSKTIHHSYLTLYYAESKLLEKMKKLKDLRKDEYLAKYGKENIPKYKSDDLIEKEKDILDINTKIDDQILVVRYLKDCLDIMSRFDYTIKNVVDLIKLENK